MPASITTTPSPSPRSRTCSTEATIQPAPATRNLPGSTARRDGRRSAGTASRRAPASAANRAGDGTVPRSPTGKPPPASNVSKVGRPTRTIASTARPRRAASRHASTAPSCDPTWRWIPRARSAPCWGRRATAIVSSVSVIPNFALPRPTASPWWVSGWTSGLSRSSTSRGGRPSVPSRARAARPVSASSSSGLSTATQRTGSPLTAARTSARRSASDLPIPSSVTRSLGMPAARATAHSPRDTTFAPRPSAPSRATTAGTSLALSENARSHGSGNAACSSAAAASSAGTEVTWTGVPKRRAASARIPSGRAGRATASVVDHEPDDRRHDRQHDGPDERRDERVEAEPLVGEPADRERDVEQVAGHPGHQQEQGGVDHEAEQPERHGGDREREQLHDRLDDAVHDAEHDRDQEQLGDGAAEVDLREEVRHDRERDRRGNRPDEEVPHGGLRRCAAPRTEDRATIGPMIADGGACKRARSTTRAGVTRGGPRSGQPRRAPGAQEGPAR